MWQVAIEMAKRCGGDRGALGLMGPDTLPAAIQPNRLIVLETEGWPEVDDATKACFAKVLDQLKAAGVTLIHRSDHPFVESLEKAIANARAVCNGITIWENRWYQRGMLDASPDGLSERAKAALFRAEAMTPDQYRTNLLARQAAQLAHAAIASFADAAITLSCPGPAPIWSGDVPGQPLAPRPTGDFVFNAPSSMLFAPVVTVPLMSVGGMPVGVQLMGRQQEDARMTGIARWMIGNVKRVAG
jgi:Asp-tRNA(Asn)/Glu-tRNA(Gln) amidotransferase A subunit family amidase